MAFKVLLGLLAAVAVTGAAVFYGHSSSDCPLAGTCPATAAVSAADDGECSACAACSAGKSKAKLVCCADGDEAATAGGDAMAALTGGVSLGR